MKNSYLFFIVWVCRVQRLTGLKRIHKDNLVWLSVKVGGYGFHFSPCAQPQNGYWLPCKIKSMKHCLSLSLSQFQILMRNKYFCGIQNTTSSYS